MQQNGCLELTISSLITRGIYNLTSLYQYGPASFSDIINVNNLSYFNNTATFNLTVFNNISTYYNRIGFLNVDNPIQIENGKTTIYLLLIIVIQLMIRIF